jgi:diadenosine tetraphosphatase ApaH/serine/threonine PP2A family protein phosphatase
MRLAVLADVHGNIDALRAVLDDLKAQSPDLTVNLGDCFSGPLWPGETADLLMGLGWPTVRGNLDRWLSTPPDPVGPWEADAIPHLSPSHFKWLAHLPATLAIGDAFLCHATPSSDKTYWLHHVRPDGTFAPSPLSRTATFAEGVEQPLILCGHTHLAAGVQLPDGRLIVNPGSVGCPAYDEDQPIYHRAEAGTPHACYAILDRNGSGWSVTFRRIPYDTRRAAALATERKRPDWAAALTTGWLP